MSMKQRLGSIIWICSREASQQLAVPFNHGSSPGPHVFLMWDVEPNLAHSCWICTASSRVGASTSTIGPSPGTAPRSRYKRLVKPEI